MCIQEMQTREWKRDEYATGEFAVTVTVTHAVKPLQRTWWTRISYVTPPNKIYQPHHSELAELTSQRTLQLFFFLLLFYKISVCHFLITSQAGLRNCTSISPFYTMSLSNKLAITDVDLTGKRVLIRVCKLDCHYL